MNRNGTALMEPTGTDMATAATPTHRKHAITITEHRTYKPEFQSPDADQRIQGQFTLTPPTDPSCHAVLSGNIYATFETGDEVRRLAATLERAANDLDRNNGIEPGQETAEDQPNYDTAFIGTVAVNSIGKVGVIAGFAQMPWGWSYYGHNVDTGEKWASRSPVVICANLAEFINRRVNQARAAARDGR